MSLLPRDKVEEGMTIEKDALNPQGQLLIPRGTVLTSRHLFILETWGIEEIHIEGTGSDGKEEETFPEEILAAATEDVNRHATHVSSEHPAAKTMLHLFVLNCARRLKSGKAGKTSQITGHVLKQKL